MASPHLHLFPEHDQVASRIGRAFGHPARIRILRLLIDREELSFNSISSALPLSRQTVLQHLDYLIEIGLVECREAAPYTYYALVADRGRELLDHFFRTTHVFRSEL